MQQPQLPPSPFSNVNLSELFSGTGDAFGGFLELFFFWLQVASMFASLFLLLGIAYSAVRINHIRKKEREELNMATIPSVGKDEGFDTFTNPRWDHVVALAESSSEQDWRVAIMEADIMLDDMMTRMQYRGETLGEKLKTVEKSDFNSIDDAWEAHKVRNNIAHAGRDYILTKRDVSRTIALYKKVFEEFHFI